MGAALAAARAADRGDGPAAVTDASRPDPAVDARLVERAREGDRDAFERLVRRHLRAAHRVAAARTASEHDADDVCQDAFLRALERIEECRRPERFRAWLLAIVRNRAADLTERRARRRHEDFGDLEGPDAGRVASDPEPGGELREELTSALEGLPERQRQVILLHDYEGWSHREVAEELGIAAGTSRYHLHRARQRLRSELSETGHAHGRQR